MAILRGVALAIVLAAGCFDPDETDGTLRCSAQGKCPPGFGCRSDRFCWRLGDEEPDAAPPTACDNGIDDDCDGKIDGEDPGCSSTSDDDEHGPKRCDDGYDNDFDGFTDYHVLGCGDVVGDPNCDKPDDDSES